MTECSRICISNLVAALVVLPLSAQREQAARQLAFGLSAGRSSGSEVGSGATRALDARYRLARLPWLSVRAMVSATAFNGASLLTDNRNSYPNDTPLFADFSMNATTVAMLVGPEISRTRGPVHGYMQALIGVTRLASRGVQLRNWRPPQNGEPAFEFVFDYPLPTNPYRSNVVTLALGTGARAELLRWLHVDLGVRRSVTQRATWHQEPMLESSGDVAFIGRMYSYQRRANTWSYLIGVSVVP